MRGGARSALEEHTPIDDLIGERVLEQMIRYRSRRRAQLCTMRRLPPLALDAAASPTSDVFFAHFRGGQGTDVERPETRTGVN